MKKTLFFILFIFLIIYQIYSISADDKLKKDKEAPPGTIKLTENLYIDKAPVSNSAYLEFLAFIERSYSKNVRDTLKKYPKYGVTYEEFESFVKLNAKDEGLYEEMQIPDEMKISWNMDQFEYLHHPYYENHPVVNVTYTQAKTFCEWRTDIVMLYYAVNSKDEKQRAKFYTKVQYRLPTVDEWTMAMEYFSDYWIFDKLIFEHDKTCTYPALTDRKNKKNFQYVPGNVAEMTKKKDVAMGLSWYDTDTTNNYYKTVRYTMPHDYLGFRCICEIIEY